MTVIDDYLENTTPAQRAELERIRGIVREMVPGAEEVISYGVPTFKYNKRPLIYFAAFKDHLSLFPASDEMEAAIGEEVAKRRTGKGTLQFSESSPIPDATLRRIITFRLETISK